MVQAIVEIVLGFVLVLAAAALALVAFGVIADLLGALLDHLDSS